MNRSKMRRQIAWQAARLLYTRRQTEYHKAKLQAARLIGNGTTKAWDVPSNGEVREQLQELVWLYQRDPAAEHDDIARDLSLHGKESRDAAVEQDRFAVYESLLLPLEHVKRSPKYHPEGDVLYHSLQVFVLAREELPYDEEFLLAALLHDVGMAIDRQDPIEAGLEALAGYITDRTEWLIANHQVGHTMLDQTIGVRAKRRLQEAESYEELMLLCRCDRAGRKRGVLTPDVQESLQHVRTLAETNE